MQKERSVGEIVQALRSLVLLAMLLFAGSAYSASKTILVLGDSLSAEYGLERGTGWVALLEKRLQQEGVDARVVNASISGDTTSGGRARLPALLKQHEPEVVVIELGGNDGLRGLPVKAARANLQEMIRVAQKAKARVLLLGMRIPPNYGRTYTEHFFNMYDRLARETKAALVPFLLEDVGERPELFQADRIHPTAEAQPRMLDNVWIKLKPLLTR